MLRADWKTDPSCLYVTAIPLSVYPFSFNPFQVRKTIYGVRTLVASPRDVTGEGCRNTASNMQYYAG